MHRFVTLKCYRLYALIILTHYYIITAQVAIQTASLAFASGCHSIVFTPGYQSTVESPGLALNNEGITKIQRQPENDWAIDPEALRAAIEENTKFIIINEPHNPGKYINFAV